MTKETGKKRQITVEITSDFVCPWCLIGETRLKQAIAQLPPDIEVIQRWRPMELNPKMPADGADRAQYLAAKFGSLEKLREIESRLEAVGRADGIEFRHDLIKRSPNTRKAHRLMLLADRHGKAEALGGAIFRAYFLEGKDIGETETLAALAEGAGLDGKEVLDFLSSSQGTEEVVALEDEASERGIFSVPNMRIGRTVIEGADLTENILTALNEALESRQAA